MAPPADELNLISRARVWVKKEDEKAQTQLFADNA